MAYAEILRLSLRHAYFGSGVPPLSVAATDAQGFGRAGCLLRKRGAVVHVLADEAEARPDAVQLTVTAQSDHVMQVTRGVVWGRGAAVAAPLQVAEVGLPDAGDAPPSDAPRTLGADICVLEIDLPAEGLRDLTLSLEAVESHWAYHLVGMRDLDGLEVIDSAGEMRFEDLGLLDLPDGRPARVIRTAEALAARARPGERFALQKSGAFGPETLVSVLPAATPPFKPIPESGAPARLQSDIFVTLW
ncbi:hypothetical protein [uncultured Roseobacter sp.]|uniref:hypothetical protein n=1 Tax=uncultured Roseobacter sp. TaxID=114847 RepID=UPI00261AE088|nr:hypothetical protein [uncultured Roseobacter sp.]